MHPVHDKARGRRRAPSVSGARRVLQQEFKLGSDTRNKHFTETHKDRNSCKPLREGGTAEVVLAVKIKLSSKGQMKVEPKHICDPKSWIKAKTQARIILHRTAPSFQDTMQRHLSSAVKN